MKAVILLATLAVASCVPVRKARSYGHGVYAIGNSYDLDHSYGGAHTYDLGPTYSVGPSYDLGSSYGGYGGYGGPVKSVYYTSRVGGGPVYYELGNREVQRTSVTKYDVQVPITYSYSVAQPVHTTSVYRAPSHRVWNSGHSGYNYGYGYGYGHGYNSYDNDQW